MRFDPLMAIMIIATATSIYGIASKARPAQSISSGATNGNTTNNNGSINYKTEERGLFPSFSQVFGKTSGLSSTFSVLKQKPEVIAALKNPVLNNFAKALEKNPKILTNLAKNPSAAEKLAKNPQVAKAAKVLEKNHVSFTAKDVGFLRSVAEKDPKKAGIVNEIVNVFKCFGLGAS